MPLVFASGGGKKDLEKKSGSDTWNSLKIGTQNLVSSLPALADIPIALVTGQTPGTDLTEYIGEKTGLQPGRWAKENEQNYSQKYQQQRGAVDEAWQGVDSDNGLLSEAWSVIKNTPELAAAYAQNPQYTLQQVVQSLPGMVAGGVAGRGLMAVGRGAALARGAMGPELPGALERTLGARWAAPVAAGAGEGGTAAASNFDQTDRTAPDYDPRRAAAAALGTGAVDLLIGAAGGRVAHGLGLETPETLITGGRRVPNYVRNEAGEALVDRSGREVLQGRPMWQRALGGGAAEALVQEFPQSVAEGGFQNLGEGRAFTDSGPDGQSLMRQGIEGAMAGGLMGAGANVVGRGRTAPTDLLTQSQYAATQAPPAPPPPAVPLALPAPVLHGTQGGDVVIGDPRAPGTFSNPQADQFNRDEDEARLQHSQVLANDVDAQRASGVPGAAAMFDPARGGMQAPQDVGSAYSLLKQVADGKYAIPVGGPDMVADQHPAIMRAVEILKAAGIKPPAATVEAPDKKTVATEQRNTTRGQLQARLDQHAADGVISPAQHVEDTALLADNKIGKVQTRMKKYDADVKLAAETGAAVAPPQPPGAKNEGLSQNQGVDTQGQKAPNAAVRQALQPGDAGVQGPKPGVAEAQKAVLAEVTPEERIDDATHQEGARMFDAGDSYRQIAEALGGSHQGWKNTLLKYGRRHADRVAAAEAENIGTGDAATTDTPENEIAALEAENAGSAGADLVSGDEVVDRSLEAGGVQNRASPDSGAAVVATTDAQALKDIEERVKKFSKGRVAIVTNALAKLGRKYTELNPQQKLAILGTGKDITADDLAKADKLAVALQKPKERPSEAKAKAEKENKQLATTQKRAEDLIPKVFQGDAQAASELLALLVDDPDGARVYKALKESYRGTAQLPAGPADFVQKIFQSSQGQRTPSDQSSAALAKGTTYEGNFVEVTDEEVAKATNLLPDMTAALETIISEPADRKAVAEHYDQDTFNGVAKKLFLKDYATWLHNRVWTPLEELFVKVVKHAVAGILAITVAFNIPGNFNQAQATQVPAPRAIVKQAVERPKANFNGAQASLDVRVVADWRVRAASGRSFIIADKNTGSLFAFNAKGELLAKTPALFGKDKGDVETNPDGDVESTRAGDKITPAGQFTGKMSPDSSYGSRVTFKEGAASVIAVHRVYLGDPKENRLSRLATANTEDNRISYGCINVPDAFYDDVIVPNFQGNSDVLVMPEQQSLAETFPGIELPASTPEGEKVSYGSDKAGKPRSRKRGQLYGSNARVKYKGADGKIVGSKIDHLGYQQVKVETTAGTSDWVDANDVERPTYGAKNVQESGAAGVDARQQTRNGQGVRSRYRKRPASAARQGSGEEEPVPKTGQEGDGKGPVNPPPAGASPQAEGEGFAERIAGKSGRQASVDVGHTLKKAVGHLAFLHDIINRMKDKVPAAKEFADAMDRKAAERIQREKRAEEIAVMAGKLDKEYAGVNEFIGQSTFEQKWGYEPTWNKGVTVDAAVADQWRRLSPDQQALADAIFQHGYDTIKEKQALAKLFGVEDAFTQFGQLKGPYSPLKRFGNYRAVLKSKELVAAEEAKDQKLVDKLKRDPAHYLVSGFDSKGQADAFAQAKKGDYAFSDAFEVDTKVEDRSTMSFPVLQKVMEKLDANNVMSPEARAAAIETVNGLFVASVEETSARMAGLKRKNRAGYDQDMVRSFLAGARADAVFMSNLVHGGDINGAFYKMVQQSKDSTGHRTHQDDVNLVAQHYADSMRYVPTPWQDRITGLTSAWQLATSLGYHLTNATQTLMVTLPQLAADFGDYKGAWKHVMDGYGVLRAAATGRTVDLNKIANPGLRAALLHAADLNLIDVGMDEDLSHFERTRSGYGAVDKTTGVAAAALHKLRQVSRMVETWNRVSSGAAAYNLARTHGKTEAQAQDYAIDILKSTQGDFSRTGAPLLIKKLPKPMVQYRKYQLMMAALYVKAANQAFKGATPEEKAIGRRMLAFKLFHTSVAAGVLGMPLMNLAGFLYAFGGGGDEPDWDLEKDLRDAVGDKDLADLLLHGVPAMAGIDLSAKLGDNQIFSILPYNNWDFSSKTAVAQTLGSLVGGPAVSQLGRFADGMALMGKGETYKGVEKLMPKGLEMAMQGFRVANDGFTMKNGDVIVSPEDIGGFTTALTLIGMPATEMKDIQRLQGLQYTTKKFFTDRSAEIEHDYARAFKEHDGDKMTELRDSWRDLQSSKDEWRDVFNDRPDFLRKQPIGTLLKYPHTVATREKKAARSFAPGR